MSPRKIIRKVLPRGLFRVVAPWGHLVEAVAYNIAYGFPARGMKVIGITGTNGKTTTSFLTHRMLVEAGYKAGLMTTVAWAIGGEVQTQRQQHMTNVPIPVLMKRLQKMRQEGVEWLVLETTSHALVQHRTWGVRYSVGVLTNVTHEHLDYHGTFEQYVAAKQLLFRRVQRNKQGLQMGIANADDQNGASFAAITQNSMTYGLEAGDVRATNVRMTDRGISYDATVAGDTYHITSHLPGSFNVSNTLATLCVGRAVGLSREQIEQGIAALESVQGRMQRVDTGRDFQVIVDYAHTPDALENVLKSVKGIAKGRVLLVFGATGDRDKSKRPVMGEVAGRLADVVFLTDDETYTEDGDVIRKAVYEGIEQAGAASKTTVVPDRREAIAAAVQAAQVGDVVLLTGIGHQEYRMMGGEETTWSEAEVVREALAKL